MRAFALTLDRMFHSSNDTFAVSVILGRHLFGCGGDSVERGDALAFTEHRRIPQHAGENRA